MDKHVRDLRVAIAITDQFTGPEYLAGQVIIGPIPAERGHAAGKPAGSRRITVDQVSILELDNPIEHLIPSRIGATTQQCQQALLSWVRLWKRNCPRPVCISRESLRYICAHNCAVRSSIRDHPLF